MQYFRRLTACLSLHSELHDDTEILKEDRDGPSPGILIAKKILKTDILFQTDRCVLNYPCGMDSSDVILPPPGSFFLSGEANLASSAELTHMFSVTLS